jgi:hypothetical protein
MADDITPVAPVTAAQPPAVGEPAAPSHRDWNQTSQNIRQLNDNLGKFGEVLQSALAKLVAPAPEAPKPAAPDTGVIITKKGAEADELASRMTKLERDYAIKSAIVEHGLAGDARAAFEELATDAPTEKIGSLAARVAKLKPSAAAALAASTVVAPPPGSSNPGPSAPGPAAIIPDKITDIPADVWRAMTPAEQRQKYESQLRKAGNKGNPFAAMRDAFRK